MTQDYRLVTLQGADLTVRYDHATRLARVVRSPRLLWPSDARFASGLASRLWSPHGLARHLAAAAHAGTLEPPRPAAAPLERPTRAERSAALARRLLTRETPARSLGLVGSG